MKILLGCGVLMGLLLGPVGCQFDGGPLITEDTEHSVLFGAPTEDSQGLSNQVRMALRRAPETAILHIQVSTVSDDSVRLSGYVSNAGVRHDAERIAYRVDGVRFVVNNLSVR